MAALAHSYAPARYRWASQLITGLELGIVADVFNAAFRWGPLMVVSVIPETWAFSTLSYTVAILVGLYLVGLVTDLFYTELVSLHLHDGDGNLKSWYREKTLYPEHGWRTAREWMWTSNAANEDFGRLQFVVSVCRNSALNSAVVVVLAVVGIVYTLSGLVAGGDPSSRMWWFFAAEGAGLGGLVSMFYFWLEATRSYHDLVSEAGAIGSPVPSGAGSRPFQRARGGGGSAESGS